MIGLKSIREKSNISKANLADRLGVTRQTVTLWESGRRAPSRKHLEMLSSFYGIEEKFFGKLDGELLAELNDKFMYRFTDETGEYYTFIPDDKKMAFGFEGMEKMLSERYQETEKQCRDVLKKVDDSIHDYSKYDYGLSDKILIAKRECGNVERYLDLFRVINKIRDEKGSYLKVPLRYEIFSVLDAMMLAYGLYSEEELFEKYPDFGDLTWAADRDFIIKLSELMKDHWNKKEETATTYRAKNRKC